MNRYGILVRLTAAILIAAIVVGIVSANIFYRITYDSELAAANEDISQLFTTVSSTASIAAYVEDSEIAREVVNGLITNNTVHGVKFKAGNVSVSTPIKSSYKPLSFNIIHPFNNSDVIGQLDIYPEESFIRKRADLIGQDNVKAQFALATVITLLTLVISHYLIIRPMVNTGTALHNIDPGASNRLVKPDFHKTSEIGELVEDINALLQKSEGLINKERTLRKEIEVLEKNFRMLFENSLSPIVLADRNGELILSNDAFYTLMARVNQPMLSNYGPLLSELFVESEKLIEDVKQAFHKNDIAIGEYELNNSQSEPVWSQVVVIPISTEDQSDLYQITLHDISKRKIELEKLSVQAEFDSLTNLTNRHGAENKLKDLIQRGVPFALVLIDLNGFKQINDVYGHDAGDDILKHVSKNMLSVVRLDDTVSRWGGDEFVLIFKRTDKQALIKVLDKMYEAIIKPLKLESINQEVSVGASIGAAFYPESGATLEQIIRRADKAMYRAKAIKVTEPEKYLFFDEGSE